MESRVNKILNLLTEMTLIDIELSEEEFEKIWSVVCNKMLDMKPVLTIPSTPGTLSEHTTGDEV